MSTQDVAAAKEYTAAIGDKLSKAIESKILLLDNLQVVPAKTEGKFVIRGVISRPLTLEEKVFAVEVDGNLKRLNVKNVDGFVDYIVPRIVDAFFGEKVTTATATI